MRSSSRAKSTYGDILAAGEYVVLLLQCCVFYSDEYVRLVHVAFKLRPSETKRTKRTNPLLKRFVVKTNRGGLWSIDVSGMLTHIGESCPQLEEFVIDFGYAGWFRVCLCWWLAYEF